MEVVGTATWWWWATGRASASFCGGVEGADGTKGCLLLEKIWLEAAKPCEIGMRVDTCEIEWRFFRQLVPGIGELMYSGAAPELLLEL